MFWVESDCSFPHSFPQKSVGRNTRQEAVRASRPVTLRPRPHVCGYFRIRNFFFPDTATVHTYPANATVNPEKNKSALQSGKKYVRNESDNVCTDISESDDVRN